MAKIKSFLQDIEGISIGYSEIIFFSVDNLDKSQVGYSVDPNGYSLVTGKSGDWKEKWIVIGFDSVGDPIFVDSFDNNLPVFTSQHGTGKWDEILIANSLDKFRFILSELKKLSVNREVPTKIRENPIAERDLHNFYKTIKNDNKELDIWWWELFLENTDL